MKVIVDAVKELKESRTFHVWGRVDPPRRLQYRSPSNLTLLQIRSTGASVKQGELLAQFDITELNQRQGLLQNQIQNSAVEAERLRLQVQLNEVRRQIAAATIRAPFNLVVQNSFATTNSIVEVDRVILEVIEYGPPRISMRVPPWIEKRALSRNLSVTVNEQRVLGSFEFDREESDAFSTRKLSLIVQSSNLPSDVDQYFDAVSVRFEYPFDSGVFRVPVSALMTDSDGQWQILIIATEQRGERSVSVATGKKVEILSFNETSALISGVEPGTWFVTDGQHRLVEGKAVEFETIGSLSAEDVSSGAGQE